MNRVDLCIVSEHAKTLEETKDIRGTTVERADELAMSEMGCHCGYSRVSRREELCVRALGRCLFIEARSYVKQGCSVSL